MPECGLERVANPVGKLAAMAKPNCPAMLLEYHRVKDPNPWPTERMSVQDLETSVSCAEVLLRESGWAWAHVQQVTCLSMQLFDQTVFLHGLPVSARQVLQAGALGHDIGYSQAAKSHHKQSFRLLHKRLRPLVSGELATMIACVARYHRKALPKSRHKGFRELSDKARLTVEYLAALLRIADGLDRAHLQRVRQVESQITPFRWQITAIGAGDIELWGAERKADLAKRTFDRPVNIVAG